MAAETGKAVAPERAKPLALGPELRHRKGHLCASRPVHRPIESASQWNCGGDGDMSTGFMATFLHPSCRADLRAYSVMTEIKTGFWVLCPVAFMTQAVSSDAPMLCARRSLVRSEAGLQSPIARRKPHCNLPENSPLYALLGGTGLKSVRNARGSL